MASTSSSSSKKPASSRSVLDRGRATSKLLRHPHLVPYTSSISPHLPQLAPHAARIVESLPLLAKVPNELVGSDRYIAWSPTAAQEAGGQTDLFLVVDDNLHTSMTYFVNSADSDGHTPNELDPDGRGPNVYLSIQRSTHGSAALATFRASRAIRAGEEVLWGYEFTAESSAPSKRSRPNQAALDALLAGRSPSDPPPPPSSPPADALATAACTLQQHARAAPK